MSRGIHRVNVDILIRKRLEAQLELSTEKLKTAMTELEKRDLRIQVLEAKAETFSKALAEMTVKAVMGGVK